MARSDPLVSIHYSIRCGLAELPAAGANAPVHDHQARYPGLSTLSEAQTTILPRLLQGDQPSLRQLCPSCFPRSHSAMWHLVVKVWLERDALRDIFRDTGAILHTWERPNPMAEDIAQLETLLADYKRYHGTTASDQRTKLKQALTEARRFPLAQAQRDEAARANILTDEATLAIEWSRRRLEGYQRVDAEIRSALQSPR